MVEQIYSTPNKIVNLTHQSQPNGRRRLGSQSGHRVGGNTAWFWRQPPMELSPEGTSCTKYSHQRVPTSLPRRGANRWKALGYVREASRAELQSWKHASSEFVVVGHKRRPAIDYSWIGEALEDRPFRMETVRDLVLEVDDSLWKVDIKVVLPSQLSEMRSSVPPIPSRGPFLQANRT